MIQSEAYLLASGIDYQYHFCGVISIQYAYTSLVASGSDNAIGTDFLNGVRNQPTQVTLTVAESDAMRQDGWSARMIDCLEGIKMGRYLCTLVTPMKTYDNMVLTDFTAVQDAYSVYQQIAGYKDVDNLLSTDELLLAADAAAVAAARKEKLTLYKTIGSIVTFGKYEQDNNIGNGPEAIEWIVLDVQDGKSLLLSRYGLDSKPYHTEKKDITWEECSLRAWLNNDFMKSVFTTEEQSAILLSNVDNSASQGYIDWKNSGGNNTQDQLFLLSYLEANKYLSVAFEESDNMQSRVAPTSYAIMQGAWVSDEDVTEDEEAAGWWWLRSPGRKQSRAAIVDNIGALFGSSVNLDGGLVRPAFWLNLESDIL